LDHPPGLGDGFDDSLDVSSAHDHGHDVEDPLIRLDLPGEASERVAIALDLKCSEGAVHDGNVSSGLALADSKLIQNQGVGIVRVFLVK
jgi:hypothetical protein